MARVYDESVVTTKGGLDTVSQNADASAYYASSETFHLSMERLDTLRGMVDEMDRRFTREREETDRKFTRERDEMDRRFTREQVDLTKRFTREYDDLTRRFTREQDDLTRRIKDLEWEIKDLRRATASHVHRTRDEKRTSVGHTPQAQAHHGPAFDQLQAGIPPPAFQPVAPLQVSENRWNRNAFASADPDAPEVVARKVKGLLNKLTMEKFDSISDQIIQWANRSENQKDGRTLIQVIRLVFEKATDEATWSEMYARLCRKMMEQISTKVHDEDTKNPEGKPIAGGQLFRKYLLNRCQEDFERGRVAKGAAAIKDANERNGSGEEVALYSEEYYIAQKAKRQGLGLIKFIGELFKLQMLTERIMHECIKKLLGNMHDPEEEEIESLCTLMTTVGSLLDTQRGRAHMDVYFQGMKELTAESQRQSTDAVHATGCSGTTMSRSSSRRGNLEDYLQADGWTVNTIKPESISMMFFMLESATQEENNAPEEPQKKKLMLQPLTKPLAHPAEESNTPSQKEAPALSEMNKEAVDAKVKEDVKEFFNVRNLDEAEVYFNTIPSQYHHSLVNKLASSAVESKEPDAKLVADLFTRAKNKGLCSPDAFEEGLTPTAEMVEHIAIYEPKAWTLFATMVNGAELDEGRWTRLASKSRDSDMLLGLLSS
ncbi:armadillo-type protein [Amanita rubescens]|nr:armadillo-type protein [Amanita rubescens]